MGREQGDHLDDVEPVYYVGTVNGREYERAVRTTAERINVVARGWVTKASLGRPNVPARLETTSPSGSETVSSGSPQPAGASTGSPSTTDQQTTGESEAPAKRGGRRAPDAVGAAPQDGVAAGTE
jgi:hypothetical protein